MIWRRECCSTNLSDNQQPPVPTATLTGFEPATSPVTGERSNQTELQGHAISALLWGYPT
jgi:hypothetical protein